MEAPKKEIARRTVRVMKRCGEKKMIRSKDGKELVVGQHTKRTAAEVGAGTSSLTNVRYFRAEAVVRNLSPIVWKKANFNVTKRRKVWS